MRFWLWCHQLMLEMATEVNKWSHMQGRAESLTFEALPLPSVGLSLHVHISASPSPVLWIRSCPWSEGVGNKEIVEKGKSVLLGANAVQT